MNRPATAKVKNSFSLPFGFGEPNQKTHAIPEFSFFTQQFTISRKNPQKKLDNRRKNCYNTKVRLVPYGKGSTFCRFLVRAYYNSTGFIQKEVYQ